MKHRIIAAAVLAAVLCLALLAACGSGEPTQKDYEAIKEGTPRSEVLGKIRGAGQRPFRIFRGYLQLRGSGGRHLL